MTHFIILDPESVLAFTGTGSVVAVDIGAFDDLDFITAALPDFPLGNVNTALSFLELTSNEDGDFDIGPTDKVAFSNTVTPLINGDSELLLPLSLFPNVDRARVTGVRFIVNATSNCTFRALALRCVSAEWVQAPLDTDTLYHLARRPVTRTGALYGPSPGATSSSTDDLFPEATVFPDPTVFPDVGDEGAAIPFDSQSWPILVRATDPPSPADPRPVDASLSTFIHTGSLTAASGDTDRARTFAEGDWVQTSSSVVLPGSFTLEAFVKPSDLNNGPLGIITEYKDVATKRGYRLGVNTSGQLVFDWSNNGTLGFRAISSSSQVVTPGVWTHVAVVYTTTQVLFYINGEPAGTVSGAAGPVADTGQTLKIGAWNTA